DFVYPAGAHAGAYRFGDIIDMDAVEHLSRLDDAMRGALAQPVDGATAWAVYSRETKDTRADPQAIAQRKPLRFGRDAPAPPRRCGLRRRRLVDPGALAVAVDPDGR